jgi:hypothetical protein
MTKPTVIRRARTKDTDRIIDPYAKLDNSSFGRISAGEWGVCIGGFVRYEQPYSYVSN